MTPITLSPELLVAMSGLIVAVVSIMTQWRAGIVKARVDEIDLLHKEIARLQDRCDKEELVPDKERRNRIRLQDYIAALRAILIASRIDMPEMPKLEEL
jgi:hypothetical protein